MKIIPAAFTLMLMLYAISADAYDYPVTDPYLATILGSPDAVRYKPVEPAPGTVQRFEIFPQRRVASIFWHGNDVRVGVDVQKNTSAPLIFIMSGTGSTFEAAKTRFLRDVFFSAGFNVISLSSPTSGEFITAASRSSVPGLVREDSADLYEVMKQAYATLPADHTVTDCYLTGFSIGGIYAGFLGELDAREHYFNFRKILMINPPVSLYDSAGRIDRLITESLPGGIQFIGQFVEQTFRRYAPFLSQVGGSDIDSEFLFELQKRSPLSDEEQKVLIGLVFRLAASDMAFTSDVMTHSGHIVAADKNLTTGDTLTGYFKQSLYWGFSDYFQRMLLPYLQRQNPNATPESLRQSLSLRSIKGYLAKTRVVGVMTNADDFILGDGDIEFLKATFGDRATIYPHGGHGGNLNYSENVRQMLAFFAAPVKPGKP